MDNNARKKEYIIFGIIFGLVLLVVCYLITIIALIIGLSANDDHEEDEESDYRQTYIDYLEEDLPSPENPFATVEPTPSFYDGDGSEYAFLDGEESFTPSSIVPNYDKYTYTKVKLKLDDDPLLSISSNPSIAIIEFGDYECPYCIQNFRETFSSIKTNYIDSGKVVYVFHDLPLYFHDPMATKEAIASQCVYRLEGSDKYFEYHNLLFSNTIGGGNGLTEEDLYNYARQLSINEDAFDTCYTEQDPLDGINLDISEANAANIYGTPSFVIGIINEDHEVDGVIIEGAYPFSTFQEVIDDLLVQIGE